MSESIRDTIRAFLLENFLFTSDAAALGIDDSLLDLGIVDSSGMMEIILFIEEKFGVPMREEEMIPDNLDSVNKITAFVERKTSACEL